MSVSYGNKQSTLNERKRYGMDEHSFHFYNGSIPIHYLFMNIQFYIIFIIDWTELDGAQYWLVCINSFIYAALMDIVIKVDMTDIKI